MFQFVSDSRRQIHDQYHSILFSIFSPYIIYIFSHPVVDSDIISIWIPISIIVPLGDAEANTVVGYYIPDCVVERGIFYILKELHDQAECLLLLRCRRRNRARGVPGAGIRERLMNLDAWSRCCGARERAAIDQQERVSGNPFGSRNLLSSHDLFSR